MSTTVQSAYGTSNQAIACTITSLANAAARGSLAIDNATNKFLDVLVQIHIKTHSGSTSVNGVVNIYAYGSADGGSSYGDGVTGTDGSVTLTVPNNLVLIGHVNAVVDSTEYISNPFSVATAFGGKLPDHWGIVVENLSGGALDASIGSAWYQGLKAEIV